MKKLEQMSKRQLEQMCKRLGIDYRGKTVSELQIAITLQLIAEKEFGECLPIDS